MAVPLQIVSPQANKPCIGFVQDAVIGSWLLTAEDTWVDRHLAVELHLCIQHGRPALPFAQRYTGRQLYSLLFPPDMQYYNARAKVRIRSGQLVEGRLCKITLGATSGGIVHAMYLSHGPDRTSQFLSDAQRLINRWLAQRGFSIRLSDCEPSDATTEHVNVTVKLAEQKVARILNADAVTRLIPEQRENCVSEIANRVLTMVGKVVHASLDAERNALYQAVLCASKGNLINIAQLIGCIGQTSVEGRRIFVTDPQGQFGPAQAMPSNGFVKHSYFAGLGSIEFFFHTMAGREGLIDTAVKTANTGYLQRRLMKAMETLTVAYDHTVRNSRETIVQFVYGGDGFDATFLVKQSAAFVVQPLEQLRQNFESDEEWTPFKTVLLRFRKHRARLQGELEVLIYAPGSVADVIREMGGEDHDVAMAATELVGAEELLQAVDHLCREVCATRWNRRDGLELLLRWHLRHQWAGRRLARAALQRVFKELHRRVLSAIVAPGEAVGPLSAQSISEPLTQLTLNSVDWNTTMAIHWTGMTPPPAPHDAEVGAFIDALIQERATECQVQPDGITVYLPLRPGEAMALSPDEDGNMCWTELEAVTRHPPINADGSNTLVKVTTESGREVTVTKGKSLLVERKGKLVPTNGDAVKVGDRVPVVNQLPSVEGCTCLNLRSVFREDEIIFSDVMIEAQAAWGVRRNWFAAFKNRCIYSRSDVMRRAADLRPTLLKPGLVFCSLGEPLPMQIPLDREFGLFIGAYLAEGCLTEHQVHISNNDPVYRDAVSVWPQRHGINFHTTNEKDQKKNNGISISIMFHSTLLATLLGRICGKLSAGKRVPGFAFAAPDIFVEGLLDGYISGDGCVGGPAGRYNHISCSSRSSMLRDGIAALLGRLGVRSTFSANKFYNHIKWRTEEDGTRIQEKYGEQTPIYGLYVGKDSCYVLAGRVSLTL